MKSVFFLNTAIRKKTTYLWLEYVQGYSGLELTTDMLEETAYELGRFQGLTIANKNQSILMENFTGVDFLEKELTQWYWQTYDYQFLCSKDSNLPLHVKEMLKRNDWDDESSIIYHYLRHKECNLPKHLKDMIYHIDDHKDSIFKYFSSFPSVINHRDFWIENIIYDNSMIYLIDCDCIGFGYLGEDLASLIGDDTLTENLMVYFERLIPAYNRGIAEFQNIVIDAKMIHEIILIKYGYRLIQNHMFTNDDNQKEDIQSRLQVLFDILNKK